MRLFTTNHERLPMVWVLLGLLFNAAGLYLGFEYSMAFVYMIVGWLCCVFGATVFVLQRQERPRSSTATRLSPKFISAGATVIMPAMQTGENGQATEQSAAE